LLVQEVRDKRELVSGIDASDDTPAYATGTFAVTMSMAPDKVGEATKAVLTILDDVKKNGVDDKRLARAKTQIKAARVKELLTAEDVASSLAEDYIATGDPHFSDKYVDRIQKITNEQLKAAAAKHLAR